MSYVLDSTTTATTLLRASTRTSPTVLPRPRLKPLHFEADAVPTTASATPQLTTKWPSESLDMAQSWSIAPWLVVCIAAAFAVIARHMFVRRRRVRPVSGSTRAALAEYMLMTDKRPPTAAPSLCRSQRPHFQPLSLPSAPVLIFAPGPVRRLAAHDSPSHCSLQHWPDQQTISRRHAQEFQANNGLMYIRNFLPAAEFKAVREHTKRLASTLQPERNAFAIRRSGAVVPRADPLSVQLLAPRVAQRIADYTGVSELKPLPEEYPLELRRYTVGSCMAWHQDDRLFTEPQLEVVYTVDNTSDSTTQWVDADGVVNEVWTEPNSALLVRADSVWHQVTRVQWGQRTILKLVLTSTNEAIPDAKVELFI